MTLDEHFASRAPELRAAFDAIVAALGPEPATRVEPRATTIHLDAARTFALVTPRRDTLKVSVLLERELSDPRVERHETVAPGRYVSTLLLDGPDQVDAQLVGWLREAQALAV